jgi:hypothetical protein
MGVAAGRGDQYIWTIRSKFFQRLYNMEFHVTFKALHEWLQEFSICIAMVKSCVADKIMLSDIEKSVHTAKCSLGTEIGDRCALN